MRPYPHGFERHRLAISFAILIVIAVVASLSTTGGRTTSAVAHDHPHTMTEEAMQRWVDEWFSKHPIVGRGQPTTDGFNAEFLALGTQFNADGDVTTLVDTVEIEPGQTVRWRRINGSHTVTNGPSSLDPEAGLKFDVPLEPSSPVFEFTYLDPGVFPFFCRPHEFGEMKGVVRVVDPTPTRSTTWGELKARHRGLPPAR